MSNKITRIPVASTSFLSLKTGLISPEWYRYFNNFSPVGRGSWNPIIYANQVQSDATYGEVTSGFWFRSSFNVMIVANIFWENLTTSSGVCEITLPFSVNEMSPFGGVISFMTGITIPAPWTWASVSAVPNTIFVKINTLSDSATSGFLDISNLSGSGQLGFSLSYVTNEQ